MLAVVEEMEVRDQRESQILEQRLFVLNGMQC